MAHVSGVTSSMGGMTQDAVTRDSLCRDFVHMGHGCKHMLVTLYMNIYEFVYANI